MAPGRHTGPARPRGRRLALAAVLGLAVMPPVLEPSPTPVPAATAAPSASSAPTTPSPQTPSASRSGVPPTPPPTGRGALLYGQSCASCHGLRGEGTQRGPSLVGVGPASVDFQLSTGRMPLTTEQYEPLHREPAFKPADINALVEYVAGFGGDGPPIPDVHPGQVQTGRQLYAYHCAACHSTSGMGAALTNGQIAPSLQQATPTQVGEAIRVGPGLMPAYPPAVLDDRAVDAIAGYVQVLQNKRGNLDRGGMALGRIGPFTEGVVAWVLGLGLLVAVIRWLGSRTR